MLSVVDTVQALDVDSIFAEPVDPATAYNYECFVRRPMDFSTLRRTLNSTRASGGGGASANTTPSKRSRTTRSTRRSASTASGGGGGGGGGGAAAAGSGKINNLLQPGCYETVQQAYNDLQRIFLNCMHYNREMRTQDDTGDDGDGGETTLGQLAKQLLEETRRLMRATMNKHR